MWANSTQCFINLKVDLKNHSTVPERKAVALSIVFVSSGFIIIYKIIFMSFRLSRSQIQQNIHLSIYYYIRVHVDNAKYKWIKEREGCSIFGTDRRRSCCTITDISNGVPRTASCHVTYIVMSHEKEKRERRNEQNKLCCIVAIIRLSLILDTSSEPNEVPLFHAEIL